MSKNSTGTTGDQSKVPKPLHQRQGRAYGPVVRVGPGPSPAPSPGVVTSGSGNGFSNGNGIGSAAQLRSPPIFSLVCHNYINYIACAILSFWWNLISCIIFSFLRLE